jgi:hypothetical protein
MADYTELAGRTIQNSPTRRIIRTRGVATTAADTGAPKKGSTLSGTTYTIAPICQAVDVDELRYPGRFLFLAVWESPVTRSEFQA